MELGGGGGPRPLATPSRGCSFSAEKRVACGVPGVRRGSEGWTVEHSKQWTTVAHRHPSVWRGCGLTFQSDSWTLLKRVSTRKGVWFKVRVREGSDSLWIGTCHFTPGCTVAQFEEEAEDFFRGLPKNASQVVFQGDVNAAFGWVRDGAEVTPVQKDGKGGILLKVLLERGLVLVSPVDCQFEVPTSRPRQIGRTGQHIDVVARNGLHAAPVRIHVDSYMKGGTDHELLPGEFKIGARRPRKRRQTRARVCSETFGTITHVDQAVLASLAVSHTKPAPSASYRDPEEVRALFKQARLSGAPQAWKAALKSRKVARKVWEADRLRKAAEGDWDCLRSVRGQSGVGWDVEFSVHQQGDPHEAIHQHFQSVYQSTGMSCWKSWLLSLARVLSYSAGKGCWPTTMPSSLLPLESHPLPWARALNKGVSNRRPSMACLWNLLRTMPRLNMVGALGDGFFLISSARMLPCSWTMGSSGPKGRLNCSAGSRCSFGSDFESTSPSASCTAPPDVGDQGGFGWGIRPCMQAPTLTLWAFSCSWDNRFAA